MSSALENTLAAIDAANALDPNIEVDADGQQVPKELLYGRRMSKMLTEFAPDSSTHLIIAARAQHIERWQSPRSDFPLGRSGYKKWRSDLLLFHGRRAGEIMAEHGYSEDDIKRVQYIIQKRQLKRDTESQTLEDVVCLVFLTYYLEAFAAKHSDEKLADIIRKTWAKMSEHGQNQALKIPFSAPIEKLLKKSLF